MKWTNDPPNTLDNQLGKKQTMRMDDPRPGAWIKVPAEVSAEDLPRLSVGPTSQRQISLQMKILQNEIKNLQSKIHTLEERLRTVLTLNPESPNAVIETPVVLTPLALEIFIEGANIADLSTAVGSIIQRLEL